MPLSLPGGTPPANISPSIYLRRRCSGPTFVPFIKLVGNSILSVGNAVEGTHAERWRMLCEQAAKEQDPQKLMELVAEIDRLLAEKQTRLVQNKEDGQPRR